MSTQGIHPVVLTILDGWGYSLDSSGNAVMNAKTPILDSLLNNYPTTFLEASGKAVGLPDDQVGNSEVGHTTIGAGRVIRQELVRISDSIADGSFFYNPVLLKICTDLEANQKKLHLIGLCSDGGVHSHIDHLFALIKLTQKYNLSQVCIHFIADGRDTGQYSALQFVDQIENFIKDMNNVVICSVMGRYYAMDRDCRWNRTELAYNILTNNSIKASNNVKNVVNKLYEDGISDEFLPPTQIENYNIIEDDGVIFFNYRPDRMRQLLQSFVKTNFKGFKRNLISSLNLATFTQYASSLIMPIVFPPTKLDNFLGEIVSKHSLRQFRISETEKYAHVTYFLNGGIEEPFLGEDRELISSPKVPTYDLSPEMASTEITGSLINAIEQKCYSLIVVNYANPDMLGHTGNFDATVKAMEIVDIHIGKVIEAVSKVNGTLIITADHGNAETMYNTDGKPHTAHTMNTVPFILIEGERNIIDGHGGNVELKKTGSLTDIAPTILEILKIPQPKEMNGKSLIKPFFHEVRSK
uniref:phosphoglycerate mutase n=1 Tax=Sahlingia subintegra TaxID=468936 RepID=UPI001FCD123B|nr:phosphoglycerate mutase [Sahlingia subintegra]UNJ17351.1 phosphoglycerate mutase [Sahlingia subintegra]